MLSGYEVVNNVNKGTAAFDTHLHDCFEINFVLSDDIEIIIEDKMFLSKSGDIFIFPPYTFHKVDSKNKPSVQGPCTEGLGSNHINSVEICWAHSSSLGRYLCRVSVEEI